MKGRVVDDVAEDDRERKRKKRVDSCQNCRSRKVKCDKEAPCNHCVRRGESSTCTYAGPTFSFQRTPPSRTTPSERSLAAELAQVKARLERVESGQRSLAGNPAQTFEHPTVSSLEYSSRFEDASGPLSVGSTNTTRGQSAFAAEKSANTQEWKDWTIFRRIAQDGPASVADASELARHQLDTPALQGHPPLPIATPAELASMNHLLSLLPTRDEALQLIEDNNRRLLKTLFGNTVHMPLFRLEVRAFYEEVLERRELERVSFDWLALFFAFILLAITHPSRYPGQYPSQMTPDTTLVLPPATAGLWHDAVTQCLEKDQMRLRSICALQAIILLDFYESDVGLRLSRLRLAITSAQQMGLHRLGPDNRGDAVELGAETSSRSSNRGGVVSLNTGGEREIQKRVWWELVVKDWCGATEPYGYVVQPAFFNTPVPCNYNDEDLSQPHLGSPRSLEEFTDVTPILCSIQLSCAIRQHGDCLHRSQCVEKELTEEETLMLSAKYQDVWKNAPSFYRSTSWEGQIDLRRNSIMVQSWMLQQGVFHKLLDLHSSSFSSRPHSFETCFDLAQSILSLQSRIRTTCSLVDQLWVNLAHSFSAAVVLCIGMLHRHRIMERQATRGLVGEAMSTFDFINAFHANAAIRMQQVIDILLVEEQEQYQRSSFGLSVQGKSAKGETLLLVAARVVKVVLSVPLSPKDADKIPFSLHSHAPPRPFHGILRSDVSEPNGVRLGQSNSALPELVRRSLGKVEAGNRADASVPAVQDDSTGTEEGLPSFTSLPGARAYEKLDRTMAMPDDAVVTSSAPLQTPMQDAMASSLIDMGDASDSFWAWLLNQDLLT